MGDVEKILLTSSLTIVGGLMIFLTGQIIQRLTIEPLQEFPRLRGEIASALIYYANVVGQGKTFPAETRREATDTLRKLSGRLRVQPDLIWGYRLLQRWDRVPTRSAVLAASKSLIFLSNAVTEPAFEEIRQETRAIQRDLRVQIE